VGAEPGFVDPLARARRAEGAGPPGPVRFLEYAFTHYFGPDGGHAGFNNLNSVGAGIELGHREMERIISRLRLMARYRFGQNVSGYAASLGSASDGIRTR